MKTNNEILNDAKRHQHNDRILLQCVAKMREHDQRAAQANLARCGCEYCRIVRYYEPVSQ